MNNQQPPQTREVDVNKAKSPPRAVDVYIVLSRLKRMIMQSVHVQMSLMENDRTGAIEHLQELNRISKELEPYLDNLVYTESPTDE